MYSSETVVLPQHLPVCPNVTMFCEIPLGCVDMMWYTSTVLTVTTAATTDTQEP